MVVTLVWCEFLEKDIGKKVKSIADELVSGIGKG